MKAQDGAEFLAQRAGIGRCGQTGGAENPEPEFRNGTVALLNDIVVSDYRSYLSITKIDARSEELILDLSTRPSAEK